MKLNEAYKVLESYLPTYGDTEVGKAIKALLVRIAKLEEVKR